MRKGFSLSIGIAIMVIGLYLYYDFNTLITEAEAKEIAIEYANKQSGEWAFNSIKQEQSYWIAIFRDKTVLHPPIIHVIINGYTGEVEKVKEFDA